MLLKSLQKKENKIFIISSFTDNSLCFYQALMRVVSSIATQIYFCFILDNSTNKSKNNSCTFVKFLNPDQSGRRSKKNKLCKQSVGESLAVATLQR